MQSSLPHEKYKELLGDFAERTGDAILLIDLTQRHIHYFNPAAEMLALRLAPTAESGDARDWLLAQVHDDAFANTRDVGHWTGSLMLTGAHGGAAIEISLYTTLTAAIDTSDKSAPALLVLRDTSAEFIHACALQRKNTELSQAYAQLATAQQAAIQNEKMASTGRLAAGIAHEINNPIGYVHSNLGTLQEYTSNLLILVAEYDRVLRNTTAEPAILQAIDGLRARHDIDYAIQDLPQLLNDSLEGIGRVSKIVQDLKDFSRPNPGSTWAFADLQQCIESTLNIVTNEIKYKAKIAKQYSVLPPIECFVAELGQVFMNILVNAAEAITEQGIITIATGVQGDEVWVSIGDNGPGIPEHHLPHIFEPFFTTKPVGHGTGLGLSISYGIIKKHHGRIEVDTAPNQGARFHIVLPVRQPAGSAIQQTQMPPMAESSPQDNSHEQRN